MTNCKVPPALTPDGHVDFTFVALMEPVGKARPRVRVSQATGRAIGVRTPQETVDAENMLWWSWVSAGRIMLPDRVIFGVHVTAYMRRPLQHYHYSSTKSMIPRFQDVRPETKPDTDNVLKLVMDALQTNRDTGKIGPFVDDKYCVDAHIVRYYAADRRVGSERGPRLVVRLWTIDHDGNPQ